MEGVGYHLTGSFFQELPRMLMFVVTKRCNSRCIMCQSWQHDTSEGELTIDEIKKIFADPFFRKIESVIISGGEPSLRNDLPEIVSTIQKSCPRLKYIWASSNGFNPALLKKRVMAIIHAMDREKVHQLTYNISIDGTGETHDRIRGIKDGYKRSMESIDILNRIRESYPINVSINTVIQPENLNELDKIREVAREKHVQAVFSPLVDDAFFASENVGTSMVFNEKDLKRFKDFIVRTYNGAADPAGLFWSRYLSMLEGAGRWMPCGFERFALVLEPAGDLRVCTMRDWTSVGNVRGQSALAADIKKKSREVRSRLRKEVCPDCPNYCTTEYALQKEFFIYAAYFFKKRILRLFNN
jgi:MoaA/NifB/PqqE/SkfB family radical SAM enzyme